VRINFRNEGELLLDGVNVMRAEHMYKADYVTIYREGVFAFSIRIPRANPKDYTLEEIQYANPSPD
jgi:hypothetical protein